MMDPKYTALMPYTQSSYKALRAAFADDKMQRLKDLKTWHLNMLSRLDQARRDEVELPPKLATLERLEMVPLDEMVREVKS
jgi:hypothetical protein